VGRAYNDGIISLYKAVQLIGLSNNPEEEIEKIRAEKLSQMTANLFEPTM
jgi:predicted HTH domain antitoxin